MTYKCQLNCQHEFNTSEDLKDHVMGPFHPTDEFLNGNFETRNPDYAVDFNSITVIKSIYYNLNSYKVKANLSSGTEIILMQMNLTQEEARIYCAYWINVANYVKNNRRF